MPAKNARKVLDSSTETKIKTAARVVFHKKGFAGARTRDIANEADINLALLNYYFKSKEKLFEIIMLETLTSFFKTMGMVFNDEHSTLTKKIHLIAEKYIDLITAEPEIPLFLLTEIRSHGAAILKKLPVLNSIMQSAFIIQYKEAVSKGTATEPDPLHFLMNIMGLIVFPFVGNPLIKKVGKLDDRQFNMLMQDRKKLIPIWIKAMLKAK
jgi:AcrR family transcriptional regulator